MRDSYISEKMGKAAFIENILYKVCVRPIHNGQTLTAKFLVQVTGAPDTAHCLLGNCRSGNFKSERITPLLPSIRWACASHEEGSLL